METLQTLQKRIDTTGKMQSIVKSMKTLSAVNIRQYERAAVSLEKYQRTITLGLQVALGQYSLPARGTAPFTAGRSVVAFGSDQGLCGRFNEKLAQFIIQSVREWDRKEKIHFLVIGARLAVRLEASGFPAEEQFWVPGSVGGINFNVYQVLQTLEKWRTEHHISHIDIFFNGHAAGTAGTPCRQSLAPIVDSLLGDMVSQPWAGPSLPQFSIPVEELFSGLIRQYLFVTLFRAQAESLASEQASRLRSLQNAEKNIDERLGELRGLFSAQRQATITAELLDIVTGFRTSGRRKKDELIMIMDR
ncbi:MAG: F0F1 ATP synthase subunit gamma [Desulfosarcina sp.]|nr:F0F1 ATP synthase subunit gamma [Desulfosarcina sp.]MBC2742240.1 F0F1 ATP synthase subunit gamma [Desulfosarcina sp.]MBC2765152.1 F0F1 ATP synthase subunit gamma [Desulfosarcina sp.]